MKLKFKSAEEFRRLLTALLDDLVDARFHFSLHQNLAKAAEEYATEFAQSPTFWGLTLSAHMDAVLLRLCRAYDTYEHTALTLRNLLDTIQAHVFENTSKHTNVALTKNGRDSECPHRKTCSAVDRRFGLLTR